jgi:CheY-like chemotaxis protein
MGLEMPIMNGLTATSRIRDFEKNGTLTGHIPIIAITANARPEHIKKAYDAGMDDVLDEAVSHHGTAGEDQG